MKLVNNGSMFVMEATSTLRMFFNVIFWCVFVAVGGETLNGRKGILLAKHYLRKREQVRHEKAESSHHKTFTFLTTIMSVINFSHT